MKESRFLEDLTFTSSVQSSTKLKLQRERDKQDCKKCEEKPFSLFAYTNKSGKMWIQQCGMDVKKTLYEVNNLFAQSVDFGWLPDRRCSN